MPPDPPPDGFRQPRQVWPPAESYVVPTQTGRVAVAWDPWQGVFVATAPTGRRWSEPRLVDLARETRATIPATVAKALRHAAAMNPGPRTQIRPAYQSPSPAQDRRATPASGASPPQPASAPSASGRAAPDLGPSPEWPPRDSHLVRSRAGLLAVAWNAERACFTASAETGQTWADRRLDDLAMSAGASMPEPVVLDLLREAGRSLAALAPPPPAAPRPAAQPEWTPDPEWVTELLRRVPPKESQRLKPVLAESRPRRARGRGTSRDGSRRRSGHLGCVGGRGASPPAADGAAALGERGPVEGWLDRSGHAGSRRVWSSASHRGPEPRASIRQRQRRAITSRRETPRLPG